MSYLDSESVTQFKNTNMRQSGKFEYWLFDNIENLLLIFAHDIGFSFIFLR